MAENLAQQIRRQSKQQVPRQAVTDAQADRTAQAVGRVIGSLCVATICRDNRCTGILTAWVTQATFSPPGNYAVFACQRPGIRLPAGGDYLCAQYSQSRTLGTATVFSCQQSSPDGFAHLESRLIE